MILKDGDAKLSGVVRLLLAQLKLELERWPSEWKRQMR
jgi:hypothetical protein